MKVVFLLDSLGSGGAERSTAVLLPHLRERGVEPIVVTLRRATEGSEDAVRSAGFEVHVLAAATFIGRCRELRRLLRTTGADVLHTALFNADQIGRMSSILLRITVVTTLVSVPRNATTTSLWGPPAWKVRAVNCIDIVTSHLFVDRFHAVTPGVARLYRQTYHLKPSRVVVVERGRDALELGVRTPARQVACRLALGIDPSAKVVLAAGRIDRQKNHADLVRAVGLLLDEGRNVVLLLAGREGDASAEVEGLRDERSDLRAAVRVLGYRPDIGDLLAASDVMALPSRFEGTAGIALEAMAVGTPIVSTDLDGMEGILENRRNSLIVSIGDVPAMANAIGSLLDDPGLGTQLAREASNDFHARFTIHRAADRMTAFYDQLVGGT